MSSVKHESPTLPFLQVAPEAKRKHHGRTVVAHISDLHFRAGTDTRDRIWEALREDLQRNSVDVLAVTGDVIDNSVRDNLKSDGVRRALEVAHTYLTDNLCPSVQIDPHVGLIVVPGNHDYRFKGLMDNRVFRVIRETVQAAPPSFDLFNQTFEHQFKSKFLPSMGLCIFTFNSNSRSMIVNFATGRVAETELIRFADCVSAVKDQYKNEWLSATRISLLHHHPMPIVSTELSNKITDNAALLVLMNSGVFMSEMINKNVDLILHGHKHCPAFSKAIFPHDAESEHSVMIVGAGSAGAGVSEGHCYNLITVYDDGTVVLHRKELKNATYRSSLLTDLRTYEGYRSTKLERLAEKVGSEFRVKKCTRLETISEGSGDVHVLIEFDGITSFPRNETRLRLPMTFTSKSGYFCDPTFNKVTGAHVSWRWNGGSPSGRHREGDILFDPPVGTDAVGFNLESLTHNGIHFNQRDRQDAAKDSSEESVSVHVKNLYDLYTLKIAFPIQHFPEHLRIQAIDERQTRDHREERLANNRFTVLADRGMAMLPIEKPLPGYTYKIVWSLPKDDIEERQLVPQAARILRATNMRLLSLVSDSARQAVVKELLNDLKPQIGSSAIGLHTVADPDLEVCIHAYDEAKAGLVMVSSTAAVLSDRVVENGISVVGQAYRRRQLVCWAFDPQLNDSDFWDYGVGHSGIVSLPLFYPLATGGRSCVITIASNSTTSSFLNVIDDIDDDLTRLAITQHINQWYATSLAGALALPNLLKV